MPPDLVLAVGGGAVADVRRLLPGVAAHGAVVGVHPVVLIDPVARDLPVLETPATGVATLDTVEISTSCPRSNSRSIIWSLVLD